MELKLVLENGQEFFGHSFGKELKADEFVLGELVFNTSMTGYQEVLSDPSYCGQMVIMTYPLIGNYGVNRDDFECLRPWCKSLIVKEAATHPSNWRNNKTLDQLLKDHNIPGFCDVDTRSMTRKVRSLGAMKSILIPKNFSILEAKKLLTPPLPTNEVETVSCKSPFRFPGTGPRIVLVDFGYKKGILEGLIKRGCDVVVVPYNSRCEDVMRFYPDGVLLSNGPGDPKVISTALPMIKELQSKIPLFAICLGHQLFALSNGADTQKMKFGHRGANHPVKDLELNQVFMTSQNHGYAVQAASIEKTDLVVTQINLNDSSVEGLKHKHFPAFSVQYHPEANPGPMDTNFLFDKFLKEVYAHQNKKRSQNGNGALHA